MLVDPIYVAYRVPAEDETKWAVRRVCPNQSGGGIGDAYKAHEEVDCSGAGRGKP